MLSFLKRSPHNKDMYLTIINNFKKDSFFSVCNKTCLHSNIPERKEESGQLYYSFMMKESSMVMLEKLTAFMKKCLDFIRVGDYFHNNFVLTLALRPLFLKFNRQYFCE